MGMNKDRIVDLFTRLVSVDSLSRGERQMADILAEELAETTAMTRLMSIQCSMQWLPRNT